MKKLLICFFFLFILTPYSFAGGGTEILTPTSYVVTVTEIDFFNSTTNQWVTAGTGAQSFDIAAFNSGQKVGDLISGVNLPNGTYTKMRCTLSRDIQIRAYSNSSGYYTTATQTPWTGTTNGQEIVLAQSETPSNNSVTGTFHSPDEADQGQPAGQSMVPSGSDYFVETWASPIFTPFTYAAGTGKTLRINFNVTNTVHFTYTIPATCHADAPVITITVADSNSIPG
ncbi:MAG: DUF4382 domain-containing protein [Candidatus Omnitrophica bacterium]|nr:DUF4382 domain-containing protein [Candidatus Omnitrophota bacterium]